MSAVENVGTEAGGAAPATFLPSAPNKLLTRIAASAESAAVDIPMFMTSPPMMFFTLWFIVSDFEASRSGGMRQGFHEQQQFGCVPVVDARIVGEADIAGTGEDRLEGWDQGAELGRQVRFLLQTGKLLLNRVGILRRQHVQFAVGTLAPAARAPVGQIGLHRLIAGLLSCGIIPDLALEIAQDVERLPRFGHVAEWFVAIDRALEFDPRLIVTLQLHEFVRDVTAGYALVSQISQAHEYLGGVAIEADRLFPAFHA